MICSKTNKTHNKRLAFTLAEALITLVIIGIIAALTIPGVLINTEQNEYKAALKKAISTLNQAIELNIALDGYGPLETVEMATDPEAYDTLPSMLKQRMNVISTSSEYAGGGDTNYAFFTADGMRYEFPTNPKADSNIYNNDKLAENNFHCATPDGNVIAEDGSEQSSPCYIVVDVNGEKKPNPQKDTSQGYRIPKPNASGDDKKVRFLDVYPVLITDRAAIPYGIVAQRAMFQND